MKKDYFAILQLEPDASDKEIRAAYKRLARKYHPDVNAGDKKAEEKFKEISEAHEVLTNPEKRRKWEAGNLDFETLFGDWRPSGRGPGGGGDPLGGGMHFEGDLGSLFGDLFGGMGGSRGGAHAARPARGADLQTGATIGFVEAMRGTSLRIPLARSGGQRRLSEGIEVKIPAGVEDGAKIRVRGKGDEGSRGGPPGDLYVALRVTPHPWFRREGKNVILDLPLSVKEATLGARLDVPTIDGTVQLTVPPGSASGQRLRLKGRGAGAASGGARGDQIVILQIVTPRVLDDDSRRLLDELDRRNPTNPRAGLGWF